MDYKYIEQLLCRYFEATATLQEEQILKAFFAQDSEELPAELRHYKSLFEALGKNDVLNDDFDNRILELIADDEQQTSSARIISLHERLRPLLRAAAVVAVVLTMSTAINQSFRYDSVWTGEEQIAHYQDEIRKAALAATPADSAANDTIHLATTGYLE